MRSYSLFLVAVDGERRPTVLAEVLGNVICDTLRANEDEDLCVLLADLVEMLDQLRPFLELSADLNNLGDVVVGSKLHGPDVHLNEILEEVLFPRILVTKLRQHGREDSSRWPASVRP